VPWCRVLPLQLIHQSLRRGGDRIGARRAAPRRPPHQDSGGWLGGGQGLAPFRPPLPSASRSPAPMNSAHQHVRHPVRQVRTASAKPPTTPRPWPLCSMQSAKKPGGPRRVRARLRRVFGRRDDGQRFGTRDLPNMRAGVTYRRPEGETLRFAGPCEYSPSWPPSDTSHRDLQT